LLEVFDVLRVCPLGNNNRTWHIRILSCFIVELNLFQVFPLFRAYNDATQLASAAATQENGLHKRDGIESINECV